MSSSEDVSIPSEDKLKSFEPPDYTYAIIGGGIAGVSCVEQILEFEPDAKILLVSSSAVVKEASNVTKLSKTLEDFIVIEKTLKSFKDVHQSVRILQDSVTKVKHKENKITTKSGYEFRYRKICICTGASPKVLFPGNERVLGIRDTESVEDLRKRISAARQVLLLGNGGIATEFVHEVKGVSVIWAIKDKSISAHYVDPGAAEFFIQCKIQGSKEKSTPDTNEANLREHISKAETPTLEESNDNPEPRKRIRYTISSISLDKNKNPGISTKNYEQLDTGSALGPDWHAGLSLHGESYNKNVIIEYETECARLMSHEEYSIDVSHQKYRDEIKEEWPLYAELSCGKLYGCDLLVSATGVIPNCGWFEGDFDSEKGIYVDENMRTTLPNVFAAGDVCCPKWPWSKHWFQMRLWTQARQMGLFAGKCMVMSVQNEDGVKNDPEYPKEEIELDFCFEMFSHVTRFFGFKVVLLGLYNGQGLPTEGHHLLIRCTKGVEYIKAVLVDWRMQGAILIGETGLEETFENLILNQIDLSSYGEDLLNPDIDIEDYFD